MAERKKRSTYQAKFFVVAPCEPYCYDQKSSLLLEEDNRWLKNKPADQGTGALGQVTAVDTDARGNVFIFHRASRRWEIE